MFKYASRRVLMIDLRETYGFNALDRSYLKLIHKYVLYISKCELILRKYSELSDVRGDKLRTTKFGAQYLQEEMIYFGLIKN